MNGSMLRVSEEVRHALSTGLPVVALESTIVAHGMPYPKNLETAMDVEAIVREGGAIPATVAVVDGALQVGCDTTTLERLASEPGVAKVSRRDLPVLLASGQLGATTVSGTLIGAGLAGIRVFVTGGIGGVHRGVDQTWDISADLGELAAQDVAVVSAGAKSILDLPKTLEVLETHGARSWGLAPTNSRLFHAQERTELAPPRARRRRSRQGDACQVGLGVVRRLGGGQPVPEDEGFDAGAATEQAMEEANPGN